MTGKHDDDDDDDEVDDDDGYIEDSVDGCRVHHRTTAHPFLHINKMYRIYSHISRRWFLRACTGCKLGLMLCSVEA